MKQMDGGVGVYQVYLMKGEYEPWWFFEDWQDLIVQEKDFSSFDEAFAYYNNQAQLLSNVYPFKKVKPNYLAAFWNDEEVEYCESCADDIQIFHGLLLLKDDKVIKEDSTNLL